MKSFILSALCAIVFIAMPSQADDIVKWLGKPITEESKTYAISHPVEEWRQKLSEFEYKILRNKGTEYAFSGKLDEEKRTGTYYSRATGQPLFHSEAKYDSRTGWPSFWQPINKEAIDYYLDSSLFSTRVEIVDSSSGSHLGHVFNDGPPPTGLRYCINSAALIFVVEGEELPALVKEYQAKYLKNSKTKALRH